MRKRSLLSVIDKIVWLIIALLPLISWFLFISHNTDISSPYIDYVEKGLVEGGDLTFEQVYVLGTDQYSFDSYMLWFTSTLTSEGIESCFVEVDFIYINVFYEFFSTLFGSSPFYFVSVGMILLLSWFCTVQIIHFFVDVLLFIPRLCQKFVEVKE